MKLSDELLVQTQLILQLSLLILLHGVLVSLLVELLLFQRHSLIQQVTLSFLLLHFLFVLVHLPLLLSVSQLGIGQVRVSRLLFNVQLVPLQLDVGHVLQSML